MTITKEAIKTVTGEKKGTRRKLTKVCVLTYETINFIFEPQEEKNARKTLFLPISIEKIISMCMLKGMASRQILKHSSIISAGFEASG